MTDISQQIADIEETLRKTPHHKATNRFIGLMRAKIARLKDKQLEEKAPHSHGSGGRSDFAVRKQGDATVVLIGPPSCGKSTLLNLLTNAESKVAAYSFTTVSIIPGMFKYRHAYIQILDIPGLIEGAKKGKGKGKEVLSVARNADLLLIMTDVDRVDLLKKMVIELEGAGIRINQSPPEVVIDKDVSGGIEIHSNIKQEIDSKTMKEIAREFGIKNGDITVKEKLSYDRLFDAFSANRVYMPALFAVNKIDLGQNKISEYIGISSEKNIGIDNLVREVWQALKLVTVNLADGEIVMKEGNSLSDIALKISPDFAAKIKSAKIWGPGSRFPGQEVSLSIKVQEGMKVKFM